MLKAPFFSYVSLASDSAQSTHEKIKIQMKLGPTWVSCYYPPAGVKALKVHTHIYTHIHTNFSILNTKNSLSYWLKIVKLTSTFFFNSFTIYHIYIYIYIYAYYHDLLKYTHYRKWMKREEYSRSTYEFYLKMQSELFNKSIVVF